MDKWIIKEVWGFNEYNGEFLKIGPSDIVVDIGAQIGVFTVFASKLAPKGKVLAYEPHPENYRLLSQNTSLNDCNNVKLFQMAVGKNNGKHATRLFINLKNSGGHSTTSATGNTATRVQQTSLSQIVQTHKIKRINYLKIDTEGSEYNILLTAPAGIIDIIDKISLEYHDFLTKRNHHELVSFLKSHGFQFQVVSNHILRSGNIIASKKQ